MSAKKKDFTAIGHSRVYGNIAEATQEISTTQEEQEMQDKPRKTYTEEEALEAMNELRTSGLKGVKLPRMNVALTPENFDYIKTMSRVTGQTYSQFINRIITDYRKNNDEIYEQAVEFRNSL